PETVALTAGRLVPTEIRRLADQRQDFAFETTLSGKTYESLVRTTREQGYRIISLLPVAASSRVECETRGSSRADGRAQRSRRRHTTAVPPQYCQLPGSLRASDRLLGHLRQLRRTACEDCIRTRQSSDYSG